MLVTTTNSTGRPATTRRQRVMRERPSPYDLPFAPTGSKGYRQSYGHGLFLWVTPRGPMTEGTKSWRVEYHRHNRKHLITLGTFPAMSLAEAEDERRELSRMLRSGEDPLAEKRAKQTRDRRERGQTFEVMALEWHELGQRMTQRKPGWSDAYAKAVKWRLDKLAIPALGEKPIASIRTRDVLDLLESVQAEHGFWQMNNLRQHLDLMFQRWMVREYTDRNPAAGLEREFEAPRRQHHPAVETIEDARRVLAAIEARENVHASTKLYHRFLALTGMRPREAAGARWSEFLNGVWTIPAERMKGRRGRQLPHVVYLAPQALDVLAVARELQPASCQLVFPGRFRGRPIERSTLSEVMKAALADTGIRHVPHGWRATLSTILNDLHPEAPRVIDSMLAHESKEKVEKFYNRTSAVSAGHKVRAASLWTEWANLLLQGAPDAFALMGLPRPESNVERLAQAA